MSHPSTQYAYDVVSGLIPASEWVRKSCQRHIDDLNRIDIYFDESAVDEFNQFCQRFIRIVSTDYRPNQPMEIFPYQWFIAGALYGWRFSDSGQRKYRRFYMEIARSGGKSMFCSAVVLYGLLIGDYPKPEIYLMAQTRAQSFIVMEPVVDVIRAHPGLQKRLRPLGGSKPHQIISADGGHVTCVASDPRGKGHSGYTPTSAIMDELADYKSPGMKRIMEQAVYKRERSQMIMITNSGHDFESPCGIERKMAEQCYANDHHFSFICGLDDKEAEMVFAPETTQEQQEILRKKANPAYPSLPTKASFDDAYRAAAKSPTEQPEFLRAKFCVWDTSLSPWVDRQKWIECEDRAEKFDAGELKLDRANDPCWLALDMSTKNDFTALACVWKTQSDGLYAEVDTWVPGNDIAAIEKRIPGAVRIREWIENNWIWKTPGMTIDYEYIAAYIVQHFLHKYNVQGLAMDTHKWREIQVCFERFNLDWVIGLEHDPARDLNIVGHDQKLWRGDFRRINKGIYANNRLYMPVSVDLFEESYLEGELAVRFSHPLRWAADNLAMETDGMNRCPARRKATAKIDPIVALIEAVGYAKVDKAEKFSNISFLEQIAAGWDEYERHPH